MYIHRFFPGASQQPKGAVQHREGGPLGAGPGDEGAGDPRGRAFMSWWMCLYVYVPRKVLVFLYRAPLKGI